MILISKFSSIKDSNNEVKNLTEILESIQGGTYKYQIEKLRKLKNNKDEENASKLKQSLPAFTVSSTFTSKRKLEYLEDYNGVLHLDYDKVDDVNKYKEQVKEIPYTLAAFVSPSGDGLKVFVKTTSSLEQHKDTFESLRSYYDSVLGVESDKSVKDVTRLCFVSYDEELYYNSEAVIFDTNKVQTIKSPEWVWNYSTRVKPFYEGNRNASVHYFGCTSNRFGVDQNDALNHALKFSEANFTSLEIERTIKSAYENNASEWKKLAGTAITAITGENEPELSPYIPKSVYENLPETLKVACEVFEGRERDVFLTTALSVISGGLHNVQGAHDQEKHYPNLFAFIVAPPASGKGSMKYAKQLGDCYHDYLLATSKDARAQYSKEKKLYERRLKKAKSDDELLSLNEPIAPKSKLFFIPANTSSSMLIKHLEDNDGMGAIVESEADTLTGTLKQDWGGYSDILRRAFQGETITKSRVTGMEYSEIKSPKFSIALTGTPNQLNSLITSVEDGLFSRFMFYKFKIEPKWKTTYTSEINRSKQDLFNEFSAWLCDVFKSENKRTFRLTPKQGERLDSEFRKSLNHNYKFYSDSASGITFRLGLMTYKIAMTLSAIRTDENEIVCSDVDFESALTLVSDVYMNHVLTILSEIDKPKHQFSEYEKAVLDAITQNEISRSSILSSVKKIGIKDRTLSDYLYKFTRLGLVQKVKRGVYKRS